MFDWLIRLALGRSRAVLIGAFVFLVVAGAFGGALASKLAPSDPFVDPSSDSARASELFEDVAGFRAAPGVLVLLKTPTGARSKEGLRLVREVTRRAKKDKDVRRVLDLRDGDKDRKAAERDGRKYEGGSFVSRDGKQTYIAVFAAINSVCPTC